MIPSTTWIWFVCYTWVCADRVTAQLSVWTFGAHSQSVIWFITLENLLNFLPTTHPTGPETTLFANFLTLHEDDVSLIHSTGPWKQAPHAFMVSHLLKYPESTSYEQEWPEAACLSEDRRPEGNDIYTVRFRVRRGRIELCGWESMLQSGWDPCNHT